MISMLVMSEANDISHTQSKIAVLTPEGRGELYQRCLDTIAKLAWVEGEYANWFPTFGAMLSGKGKLLVQWCHGSPEIVTGLCDFPKNYSDRMEQLFLQAGELTWQAGPLTKGPGLCHGTAGNGYAFLKLYQRAGEVKWLERTRAFAMHAIAQCDRARQQYAQGRYSLWTGDLGLAVYLWHCLSLEADLPTLDIF